MPNCELSDYPERIEKSILIQADASKVWDHLTVPHLMKEWMGDEEMQIEIITDWRVGSPFVIKGFHHVQFENKGTILQFEPESVFQYEYLSSMSNLADEPNNYTTIMFQLHPENGKTLVAVEAANFPTFEIYKHLEFYWNGTLAIIKWRIEN